MNDRHVLDELEDRLKAGLYPDRAPRRIARRRWLAPLGGLAVAAAVAVIVVVLVGSAGVRTPVAAALDRAARAAQQRSGPPTVGAGQFWYTRTSGVERLPLPILPKPPAALPKGTAPATVALVQRMSTETWVGLDGTIRTRTVPAGARRFATPQDRARYLASGNPLPHPNLGSDSTAQGDDRFPPGLDLFHYRELLSLPTDPHALYQRVHRALVAAQARMQREFDNTQAELRRQQATNSNLGVSRMISTVTGGRDAQSAAELNAIKSLLESPVPPAVRAALYRAAALIPGVRYDGHVDDSLGRAGVGVSAGRPGSEFELIFDPATGALLGEHSPMIGDSSTVAAGVVDSITALPRASRRSRRRAASHAFPSPCARRSARSARRSRCDFGNASAMPGTASWSPGLRGPPAVRCSCRSRRRASSAAPRRGPCSFTACIRRTAAGARAATRCRSSPAGVRRPATLAAFASARAERSAPAVGLTDRQLTRQLQCRQAGVPPLTMTSATTSQIDQLTAAAALHRARAHLRARQHADGWWKGALDTNVTMDAEDLLLREFLGIRGERETRMAANWIRSEQRDDGSWGLFYGADGDLSTTVEAYAALRLAGDAPDAPHMRAACAFVRAAGGLERSRAFTRIWLALFGLWPWDDLPALAPEIMLLPPSAPLSIYQFGCWARQTVVALSIVMAERPERPLPFGLDELRTGERPSHVNSVRAPRTFTLAALDRAARVYNRRPFRPLRRHALERAERWVVARQEADGSWGGIQPPWVYSLMALHLRGYAIDHPVMRAGLEGLERFVIEDGDTRRLEACQSPVWDTALAITALSDAGVPADDPDLVRAAEWLLDEEVTVRGDWAVRRRDVPAGGWAFEFANDNYPDVDDTAEVILALRRVAHPDRERVEAAIARGVRWTLGLQSEGGGWAAFDADNTSTLVADLPFCDFGEVTDPPSADVTAHAIEMLALEGHAGGEAFARGLRWLRDEQEPDGSWFGRWGLNHVYGTSAALLALEAAGAGPDDLQVRRAVRWLEEHQNADGGWGEDARSYEDPAWIGRGESTASQTAWALLALHAAGERSAAMGRGIAWLVDRQRPDGGWDEPQYTGTGFPGDFYINYELYRLVFPVMALGRWVRERGS